MKIASMQQIREWAKATGRQIMRQGNSFYIIDTDGRISIPVSRPTFRRACSSQMKLEKDFPLDKQ